MTNSGVSPEQLDFLDLLSVGVAQGNAQDICDVRQHKLRLWRKNPCFARELQQAQQDGWLVLGDTLLRIPLEQLDPQRARLLSENIRWLLARRHAAVFGDRMSVDVNQTIDIAGPLLLANQRRAALSSGQVIEDIAYISLPATDSQSVGSVAALPNDAP